MPIYDDYNYHADYQDFEREYSRAAYDYENRDCFVEDIVDSEEEFDELMASREQDAYERAEEDRFDAMHDGDYEDRLAW